LAIGFAVTGRTCPAAGACDALFVWLFVPVLDPPPQGLSEILCLGRDGYR